MREQDMSGSGAPGGHLIRSRLGPQFPPATAGLAAHQLCDSMAARGDQQAGT
jgi:hypothetical protein